ncbi:MAG: DUF6456 domain-containing protein [Parvibaculaceae bacterium]|nr:DUF6456 domain-containing protein [Parvibaculaceae bacterium]
MSGHISPQELDREIRRCFRWLDRDGAFLREEAGGGAGVHLPRRGGGRAMMRVPAAIWEWFRAHDLVERMPEGEALQQGGWRISATGRARWQRLCSDDPFRDQHRLAGRRVLEGPDGVMREYEIDLNLSALAWLHHRKSRDGAPLIDARQFEAGERLERVFRQAALSQRVTFDWTAAHAPQAAGRGRDPAMASDQAMDARKQMRRALDHVGPGLAEILVEVCGYQQGLEAVERSFNWPRRSARVVLQLALDRLADHYGLPRL